MADGATKGGGAVYMSNLNYNVYFTNCTYLYNVARGGGGGGAVALLQSMYYVYFFSCNFVGNSAMKGGAFYFTLGNGNGVNRYLFQDQTQALEIHQSSFTNNTATQLGGAFYFLSYTAMNFYGVDFFHNSAGISGGAIYMDSSNNVLEFGGVAPSFFYGNRAAQYGGAIYMNLADNVTTTASSTVSFEGNVAPGGGGAIYAASNCTLAALGSINFVGNSGANGGAVAALATVNIVLGANSNFDGNVASGDGGGIYMTSTGSITMATNVTFTSNTATQGGAIYASTASIAVNGMTYFGDNVAKIYGGALYLGTVNVRIGKHEVVFVNNTAAAASAMYLGASGSSTMQIEGSNASISFERNTCLRQGGTVFWVKDAKSPDLFSDRVDNFTERVLFSKNKGPIAGAGRRVATQAMSLANTLGSPYVNVKVYNAELRPHPVFKLQDLFGTVNTTDQSSVLTAKITSQNCLQGTPYLSGITTATAINGVASFKNLSVFCYPQGDLTLSFTVQLSGLGTQYSLNTSLHLYFRNCKDGEILSGSQFQLA